MWFKVISILIAAVCLLKAGIGLLAPVYFYRVRERHYRASRIPLAVLTVVGSLVTLTAIAWYATFTADVRFGWIVTAFLTAVAILAIVNLTRWDLHRQTAMIAVRSVAKRRAVDILLITFGIGFLMLAWRVY